MPFQVRDLVTVTFSSGATATPTIFPVDDASNIGISLSTVTSSGTFTVQVEPTDTGVNWGALIQAGTAITVVGSQNVVVGSVGFRQMRLTATAAVNDGRSVSVVKQISV